MSDFLPSNPDFEVHVRETFQGQPFMALIGAELTHIEPGYCEVALLARPECMQQDGYLHAGATASIADAASGAAAQTLMPASAGLLAVEFKINLLAPGRGERFIARARVLKPGRTLTVVATEIEALQGESKRLIAAMQSTLICLERTP